MTQHAATPYHGKETIKSENDLFAYSFLPGALFVVLLWLFSFLSYLTGANLAWLGIFPRHFFGLIGVIMGPLIHSGLVHLLSNSFPLLLLSGFILYMHRPVAARVLLLIYVASGLLTWVFGRQSYHIGASGLVYGMAGYLLLMGFLRRNRGSMAVSLAVLFLYSGLFQGLFPDQEHVSWEGHIAGLLAGMVAAVAYGDGYPELENQQPGPIDAGVAQRHLSSTIGYHYRHLQARYIIRTDMPAKVHTYVFRTASANAGAPTQPVVLPSKSKLNLNSKYGRKATTSFNPSR